MINENTSEEIPQALATSDASAGELIGIKHLVAPPEEPAEHPILGALGNLPHHHYAALHRGLALTSEDRARLRSERGFSDALIDACQFRSCGPYAEQVVRSIFAMTPDCELASLGVLYESKGVSEQLTKPNILIPYFLDAKVVSLRAHKNGFKGISVLPYIPPTTHVLLGQGKPLIIAESEFKAAAATDFGFPALGVPGISVMISKHFSRLMAAIRSLGDVREIVIMFDSEEKLDPDLPNYKPDPRNAWDTQYRAIQHAEKISAELPDVRVRIATLPAAWRIKGKIDIDGALANGRTRPQFAEVVKNAVSANAYLYHLPEVDKRSAECGKKVIDYLQLGGKKNSANRFAKGRYRRVNGAKPHYQVKATKRAKKSTERDGEDEIDLWVPISNFTISFHGQRREEPGAPYRYLAELRSDSGKALVEWKPELQQNNTMKVFVTENLAGAFWSGEQQDLTAVLQTEMQGRFRLDLFEPSFAGFYDHDGGVYLFGNCAIRAGKLYLRADATPPGKEEESLRKAEERKRKKEEEIQRLLAKGLVPPAEDEELDEEEHLNQVVFVDGAGYTILPPTVGSTGHKVAAVPVLETSLRRSIGFLEVVERIQAAYPGQGEAAVLLVAASIAGLIQHRFPGQVPVLYLWGTRGTRKTTLALYLRALAGIPFDAAFDSATQSSEASRARALSYFSSLPFLADDVRFNDERGKGLIRAIRSAADRSSASRAAGPTSTKTLSHPVRASFVLTGEDITSDGSAATISRMIAFEFQKGTDTAECLEAGRQVESWASVQKDETAPLLSTLGRDFLLAMTKNDWALADKITGEMRERWLTQLIEAGAATRTAHLYSGPAAVAEHLFGENHDRLKQFSSWLFSHIPEVEKLATTQDVSDKFYADLALLDVFALREVLCVDIVDSEVVVVLALSKAAQYVSELRGRRGEREDFSATKMRNEVLESLRAEAGLETLAPDQDKRERTRADGRTAVRNLRCVQVPLRKAPAALQDLVNEHYDSSGKARPINPGRQARLDEARKLAQGTVVETIAELMESTANAVKSKGVIGGPKPPSARSLADEEETF